MSWLWTALLAVAVLILIGAEWPRLNRLLGAEHRRNRERARRKANFQLLRTTEEEEFAASVERDLDRLPTIERDRE